MVFGIDPGSTCNTGLGLGLACSDDNQEKMNKTNKGKVLTSPEDDHDLFPSLSLGPPKESYSYQLPLAKLEPGSQLQPSSPSTLVSSFSTSSSTVKKEKAGLVARGKSSGGDDHQEAEVELEERVQSSRASDHEDEESGSPRKKLRLTKEQSAVLEDKFKEHSTLNPLQKHALAEQLNLRPRQVEVWFQNRRARTKLKQTEIDCEVLKRSCETLKEENRRLYKEIQELKALKPAVPFYMHFTAATLTMCPSCERAGGGNIDSSSSSKPLNMVGPKSGFYNPFSYPSAAY